MFICLTSAITNKKVWVNISSITFISAEDGKFCGINLMDSSILSVKETEEEIVALLKVACVYKGD